MNTTERRLTQLFKTFVQRALIPQIKKFDGSITEWNKFMGYISFETIDYNQVQLYVDTLSPFSTLPIVKNESNGVIRRKEDNLNFNPSKTFGGVKSKLGDRNSIQPSNKYLDFQPDSSLRQQQNQSNTAGHAGVCENLKMLIKNLEQNHKLTEKFYSQNYQKKPSNSSKYSFSLGSNNNDLIQSIPTTTYKGYN